jgi:hypothetical protein
MNDVMVEECEINPSFQTKKNKNPKSKKIKWKKNKKINCMLKQFENHVVKILYVGFLCVWLITKMLMFKQAFKPWEVFFVTIVLFCFVTWKLKWRKVSSYKIQQME